MFSKVNAAEVGETNVSGTSETAMALPILAGRVVKPHRTAKANRRADCLIDYHIVASRSSEPLVRAMIPTHELRRSNICVRTSSVI